jgi:hypothetical protein
MTERLSYSQKAYIMLVYECSTLEPFGNLVLHLLPLALLYEFQPPFLLELSSTHAL